MNSLSWFIYLAGAMNNLQVITGIIAGTFVVVIVARVIGTAAHNDSLYGPEKSRKLPYPSLGPYLSAAAFFALVSAAVPSSGTMYAIAASEVGEQVVKNEVVQGMANDATKALNQWIKRQIEPETKK